MNGENELPEGWISIKIPEICEINPKKPSRDSIPSDTPVTFIPMPAVDADMGAITEPERRKFGEVRNGFTFFQDGDVIFAKITPCMENGKAAIARNLINGLGFGSTEFFTLRSNGTVVPEYIYHFIRQESFRKAAEENMTGSVGQKRVPKHFIENSIIPLPPLAEQRRIVAAVEQLLARVNASRERLDRVPGLLKAFRQAVLAAACSGRLTEGWREEHGDNSRLIGSPVIQDVSVKKRANERNYIEADIEYPILPISWKWLPIGEFKIFIGSGITPRGGKNAYQRKDGVPFIRSQNVYPDGLRFDDIAFISEELHNTMLRTHTKPNDVLLNITGASIGRSTFIPPEIPIANVNQHVCIIRTDGSIFPKYLSIFLNSQIGQDQIYKLQGGQTREGLNYHQVRSIKVSIPPLPEQHEIIRRVESLFALADRIEQRVAISKERADRLTQAILSKAFRGELVPIEAELARREGREYEPASVLLERIRREKEAKGQKKIIL